LTAELSIIVPTYNERDNVGPLVDALSQRLTGFTWEIIFVDDDSPDGTSDVVRSLALTDGRIHCIQRLGRRGLSSACIEGVLASSAPYLCIMDADMQHDEAILADMFRMLTGEKLDMVIGSRYLAAGSTGTLASHRKLISRLATRISRLVLHADVTDPMSGYFAFSREFFQKVMHGLSGRGFKILLDMIAASREPVRFREIPYTMRSRARGESKLNLLVMWDFLLLILNRLLGSLVPYRFLSFAAVGASGLLVHLFVLWILYRLSYLDFTLSQSAATLTAMTSNYVLNNMFTYYDMRKTGGRFWMGLLWFYLVCMLGAILNVAIAAELFRRGIPWLPAGAAGAVAGAVWNFSFSSILVWRLYPR
jgi:dolichol-phosphate mannosyltransferase